MFVLILKYTKSAEEVDKVLPGHKDYLSRYYELGNFIVSGRQNPRVGGVILCNAASRGEVEAIIKEDPFLQEQVAEYSIIEFIPTGYTGGFEQFVK